MELTGFNLSRSIGVIKAGEGQCICTIKISFTGITITGCCYIFETRPTASSNPDDFIPVSHSSLFGVLVVLLHLA